MKNERGITRLGVIFIVIILIVFVGAVILLLNNNESEQNKENKKEKEVEEIDDKIDNEMPDDLVTTDISISITSTFNGETSFGGFIQDEDGELIGLSVLADDFDLPEYLSDYKSDIILRVKYSEEDYTVYDCQVINPKTNEIVENLSEKNLKKLFDIEYNKDIIEKEWTEVIKLSELEENEIYKYTANETTQFPEIENDIEENCLVYIKESIDWDYDNSYEKEIHMYNNISSTSASFSFYEVEADSYFNIMYETLDNKELLELIEQDELIKLSDYNNGDELSYSFEKYIYNDTEHDITLNISNSAFGIDSANSVTIEAGAIYGFDWMIDSVNIEY